MRSVNSIAKKLYGKRILLRVDFNLPMEGGKFLDEFRLLKALPTIKLLKRSGAKIVLISHLESAGKNPSFRPLPKVLKKHLGEVVFAGDVAGGKAESKTKSIRPGEVILFENLRRSPGEEKNSADFVKKLARLGDVYVNEAFSASHRKHASIVGVTKYLPSFAGPLFLSEISALKKAMNPPRPFMLILGGNKLQTKIPLIEKFFNKADCIALSGLMMLPLFPFWGWGTGRTVYEKASYGFAKKLSRSPNVLKPKDLVVSGPNGKRVVASDAVGPKDIIRDPGLESLEDINSKIKNSRFVFWNGPLGRIEDGFNKGTIFLVRALKRSRAKVFVGGGDTASFLHRHGLTNGFDFISTGGGASLDFLAKGTLPGIEALKKSRG